MIGRNVGTNRHCVPSPSGTTAINVITASDNSGSATRHSLVSVISIAVTTSEMICAGAIALSRLAIGPDGALLQRALGSAERFNRGLDDQHAHMFKAIQIGKWVYA